MISQIYLVKYGSYVGYASTYKEAIELEERYKTYTENSGAFSITENEMRDYRDKHKPTVLKSDDSLNAIQKETATKDVNVTSLFENGNHNAK